MFREDSGPADSPAWHGRAKPGPRQPARPWRHGRPDRIKDLARHRLIGAEGDSFHRRLSARFPDECFTLMVGAVSVECRAVRNGLGIGLLGPLPALGDMVELFAGHVAPHGQAPIWPQQRQGGRDVGEVGPGAA